MGILRLNRKKMRMLCFIYAATAFGKIIISEYYLPYKQKTIKPCALGGLMGGQKYIVHNILFKFAVDNRGLFGSDYAAAKVAGNELRGLISYFKCHIDDLNVPLMALVDYRGIAIWASQSPYNLPAYD